MPGMVHNIRIVFGAQTQPSITIQQSDYNSRTIQAACFTSSGTPMDFSDTTVTVVYNAGAEPTKEYPVTVEGNILSFTIPGLAAQTAGSWSMQIFIYWAGSLLHSAEIPYTVLKTITPGTGGDDPVPALVLLIQQAQDAIGECNKATENANKTVANIEKKLADGDFIGKTGDRGPQGFQGVGVTGASLNGRGELVFTVKDPATGESSTLLPVDIDTSAAINTVEQAAQDGVQKVQDAQASAISAVDQAGKNAGTQAVIEVYSAKDTAIADIATVKSGAESAITAAQQSAVQTVQQSGTTAVGQVQKAQNTATTAIAQAQQNAITSVENEGDAQVQRLQEIVPQPTADNNGMVVAVQSGAYQLENPAGLVLNDGVIKSENGWSSMQIVKTLCPPFTVSGATVQCTPVANYPLGVQVEITPTQEGTGDPSPENVRPIVGWDAVNVWRGGKNLCDGSLLEIGGYAGATGTPYQTDKRIRTAVFSIPCNKQFYLSFLDGYTVTNSFLYGKSQSMNKELGGSQTNNKTFNSSDADFFFAASLQNKAGIALTESDVTALAQSMQLEIGSTATAYEPYRGQTHTIQLGQTVYGGTLDVGTGTLTVDSKHIIIDDPDDVTTLSYSQTTDLTIASIYPVMQEGVVGKNAICSHFFYSQPTYPSLGYSNVAPRLFIYFSVQDYPTIDSVKEFFRTQAQNGSPVQVVYKLESATTIQLTPQQILALSGTNTLFADAGNITVTGASDPIATITALQNRVSALESAHTEM